MDEVAVTIVESREFEVVEVLWLSGLAGLPSK